MVKDAYTWKFEINFYKTTKDTASIKSVMKCYAICKKTYNQGMVKVRCKWCEWQKVLKYTNGQVFEVANVFIKNFLFPCLL